MTTEAVNVKKDNIPKPRPSAMQLKAMRGNKKKNETEETRTQNSKTKERPTKGRPTKEMVAKTQWPRPYSYMYIILSTWTTKPP